MKNLNNVDIEKMIESGELVKEIDFAKILNVSRSLIHRYRSGFYISKKKYNKKYIYESKFNENEHYIYYKGSIYWYLKKKIIILSLIKTKAILKEIQEL